MNVGPALLWGAAGIPVGAFLNVVVERVPDRTPLRAAIEGDPTPPRSWLGVPVQPWLLRGPGDRRARWLAVEVATAIVFGIFGFEFGDTSVVLPLLVLGACLVAITFVDLEHLRIPDRITFPSLGLGAVAIVAVSLQRADTERLWGAVVGAVLYFGLLLLPHLAYPRGMGFGDVKLALVMGMFLGWLGWERGEELLGPFRLVLYALMLGCLLGVVFGLVHQAVTRRRGEFPFGPALAVACIAVAVASS